MGISSLIWGDILEEGTGTHSSTLAWRIPRTEKPGELQSMGSQRIWHNWSDLPCTHIPTLGRQSALLSFNLIPKHLFWHTQNKVWQNIWAPCDPVKLIHKISHHRNAQEMVQYHQNWWGLWWVRGGKSIQWSQKKLELEERLPYMIFEYKNNNNCQNYSYTSKVVGVEIMGNKYVILSLPA